MSHPEQFDILSDFATAPRFRAGCAGMVTGIGVLLAACRWDCQIE
jgi:hypothetical protein